MKETMTLTHSALAIANITHYAVSHFLLHVMNSE